jgi:imidazolonepropionase-like amidohydrolase
MTLWVLNNANVLDTDKGEILSDRHVVIEGKVIREIATSDPGLTGANSIDLRGATLMPGLIDAHVHVTAYAADFGTLERSSPAYVAAQAARILDKMLMRGFTTVRDVGGADFGLARAVEEGLFRGPRLLFGGKALSQTGGHGDMRPPGVEAYDAPYTQPGLGVIVDGVADVRRAARAEVRRGAHHIKFMGGGGAASPTDRLDSDQFSEEEVAAIVEEATMANLYAVVHAYSARTIERALRLGVRSIEHGNYLDETTADLLKEKGAYLVPTLVTYRMGSKLGAQHGVSATTLEKLNALVAPGLRAVELARRKNIPMAYGTDLVGLELHEFQLNEFSIRREVVSAKELLRSATVIGAELVRMDKRIGRVKENYLADLLAIRGNPLDDIAVLERPDDCLVLGMKEGQLFKNALS